MKEGELRELFKRLLETGERGRSPDATMEEFLVYGDARQAIDVADLEVAREVLWLLDVAEAVAAALPALAIVWKQDQGPNVLHPVFRLMDVAGRPKNSITP